MPARDLSSRSQHASKSCTRDPVLTGIRWQIGTTGAVGTVVAPLGYTVARTGVGVYVVTLPYEGGGKGATVARASDGTGLKITRPSGLAPNQWQYETESGAELASGTSIQVLAMAVTSPNEWIGTNVTPAPRHVQETGQFPAFSSVRDTSFIPFSGTFSGGELTIDDSVANVGASKSGTGLYALDIGVHPVEAQLGIAILSSGDPASLIGGTGDAGTITLQTGATAADPADDVTVQGFIWAATLNIS